MSRRTKLKRPISLAGPTPAVHNRQATDLLRNAMVAPIEVSDPYDQTAKILVMRSIRDCPLTRLHAHGHIDDAQFQAGRLYQKYCEIIEVGGAKAIDFTREAVDGGGFRDNRDSDTYNKAFNELNRISEAEDMTMLGEQVLRDVLANRMFLNQVAAMRNITPEEASKRFKTALEIVTMEYGFTMRGT